MRLLIFILFSIMPFFCRAQHKNIISFQTTENTFATTDRAGDLYLVKTSGDIEKYTSEGTRLHTFHHPTFPTLFDTGNGVRLLVYYRSNQTYRILNPSLSVTAEHTLDSAFAISPWLVCSSGDYNFWILDAADWSLKKIDGKNETVILETSIDTLHSTTTPSFIFFREYQNFLFLLDANNGILIFNAVGKFIRSIPVKNLTSFNFLGEDLYFIRDQKLVFINLFTLEETQKPIQDPASFLLLTDEKMYSIYPAKVEIRNFTP